nr:acetamidase/formamidase family protein [Planosporangium flavigriseum]
MTRSTTHTVWDRAIPPAARVVPGDEVTVEVANSSGGQLAKDSTVADVATLDFSNVNPVTGPLAVDGVEPGDVLVVDILDIDVDSWGWTANIPGFGLLADDFPDAHLRISSISAGSVELLPGLVLPSVPMIGTIGVAPPAAEPASVVVPTRFGGNMDIRHVTAGARLLLPVGVPDALLSLGDTHAAQGDGEICGTGIETSSVVRFRVDVIRGRALAFPIVETDPRTARAGRAIAVTAIGPDLMQATRDAARGLVDEIVLRTGLAPLDAYLFASVAADLKISEVVDAPNWVVSMHVERDLLT